MFVYAPGASPSATWAGIEATSSLARALATVYDAVAAGQIAHVSLGHSLDLSLQIPRPTSTPHAPTPTDPQLPGLWLSTANVADTTAALAGDDEDMADSDDATADPQPTSISPHAAILLLTPTETLLKDVANTAHRSLAGPLDYFVRHLTPTRTLLQLSSTTCSALPLASLQQLAAHLVRWRRARALAPPLHASHTYIPSPNMDAGKLRRAEATYAARFAALPSLSLMLAKLGRTPAPYATFIPSKDHKAAYMAILAWLVRGGWVTQLRTFAWVRVDREVKKAVARKMRAERRREQENLTSPDEEGYNTGEDASAASHTPARRPSDQAARALSPRSTPHLFAKRPVSDAGSASSVRTAVPVLSLNEVVNNSNGNGVADSHQRRTSEASTNRSLDVLRPLARLATKTSNSVLVGHEETEEDVEEEDDALEPSLVLSPHKADALESQWLEHIGSKLRDEDLRDAWPMLVKYFDGKRALEEIATREGIKRKVVAGLLARLIGHGDPDAHADGRLLVVVRYW